MPSTVMMFVLTATTFLTLALAEKNDDRGIEEVVGPSPSMSQVCFFRTGEMLGTTGIAVLGDGELIGELKGKRFLAKEFSPGPHEFIAGSSGNMTFLEADLAPDRIYYVQVEGRGGTMYRLNTRMDIAVEGSDALEEFFNSRDKLRLGKVEKTNIYYFRDPERMEKRIAKQRKKLDKEDLVTMTPEDGWQDPLGVRESP
jgi:hypothetical protein